MKNIAIFMPRFIGDCINTTPALALIKASYPDATIYLIMQRLAIPVFARDQRFEIINYDRSGNKFKAALILTKTLKTKNIDGCILFTSKFLDALIAKLAGATVIVGHNTESRGVLLDKKLRLETGRHYINRYAYVANLLCNNQHEKMQPVAISYDENNGKLKNADSFNIGFSILNEEKQSRYFPIEETIETIKQLQTIAGSNFHYYMLGSPSEAAVAKKVVGGCQKISITNINNLAGETTVTELIDSIACLDLLITVDSSPLHIAAATKTPVIVLEGKSASPLSAVFPKGKQAIVINNRGNYINDNDQIKDIDIKEIVKHVSSILAQSKV